MIGARQRGFTLIELMIVLVIIGIASAAIGLSIKPDPTRALREDAQRLAQMLDAAQSQVFADGRPITWRADGQGYRFVRGRDDSFSADPLLRPQRWKTSPVQVHLEPNREVVLNAEWIGSPLKIELSDGQHQVLLTRSAIGKVSVQ